MRGGRLLASNLQPRKFPVMRPIENRQTHTNYKITPIKVETNKYVCTINTWTEMYAGRVRILPPGESR